MAAPPTSTKTSLQQRLSARARDGCPPAPATDGRNWPPASRTSVVRAERCRVSMPITTALGPPAFRREQKSLTAGDNGDAGGCAGSGSVTFSDATHIARDMSRPVSGRVKRSQNPAPQRL